MGQAAHAGRWEWRAQQWQCPLEQIRATACTLRLCALCHIHLVARSGTARRNAQDGRATTRVGPAPRKNLKRDSDNE